MNRLKMMKIPLHVLLGLFPVMAVGAEQVRVGDFDDALAKIAATVYAKPGQQAMRDWTALSGGSVRLVGSFQKLSMKADAEVEVQVDGHTIWRQKLAATDTIRHGFDITAYDLEALSKVEG